MSITQYPEPFGKRSIQLAEAYAPAPDADSFNFRRTLLGIRWSCRAHRLLIVLTCLLTIAITEAYIVIWPPIYIAEVIMVAESDKDQSKDEFYRYWHMFRKDRLSDEVQLFTAPTALKLVIERLGLGYDDVYHSFFSYAGHLWQESWVGKNYRRMKELIWPRKRGKYDPTPQEVELGRTLTEFKTGVGVEAVSDTNVGRLVVRGPSSRVAEVANAVTDVYLEQRIERHRHEAQVAYDALLPEVELARAAVRAQEAKIAGFNAENNILLSMEKDKLDVTRLSVVQTGIADIQTSMASATETLATINSQLAVEPKDVVMSRLTTLNTVRQTLKDKAAQLTLARKQMLIHYKPDAPEVTELERQLAVVNEQLARQPADEVSQTTTVLSDAYESLRRKKTQLESDLAGQRAALTTKLAENERITAAVIQIPEKMKATYQMERERQMLEKRYVVLQEKLTEADITRTMAGSAPATITIIERATPPDEPVWPRSKLLLAAAAAIGAMAGVGLALLLDLLSGRVDRYRLASGEAGVQLYAILSPDKLFAAQFFPLLSGAAKDKF
jgi:uncharacterized protein involved in exopolysaccharide biosynthesis